MARMAVITKSFAPDFELSASLNRSVLENSPDMIHHHVIAIPLWQSVWAVLLVLGAAILLQAASPCRAAEGSTDSTWSQGLTLGVNGPIPVIVVDQFGYPTKAAKIAVIRNPQVGYDSVVHFTPGKNYAVVDRTTRAIIKRGAPTAWNDGATDTMSGDKVWWFDFSDVTTPGTYTVVDLDKGLRSAEFEINDRVYRDVLKHAVRMYFYQRAGFEKTAATAGADWADAASHMRAGQDPQTSPWKAGRSWARRDVTQLRDLHGGWFDAGDYNKYTSWTARVVIILLRAYDENPNAFGDDSGIAESGNGVPDILDEIKWALDWLERMQNIDGSLLCVQGLSHASPPSAATGPSYYGPATTAASLMGAAVFAYAAKIYSARGEDPLRRYGSDLAMRAKKAWDWAIANPGLLYYNNDDTRQPGSRGLAAGQQEMDDAQRLFAKFEAAVYLYELTGDAIYRSFVESNYTSIVPSWGPTLWDAERQESLLYYARLPGISVQVRSAILTKFIASLTGNADQLPMANKDPYRSPIKTYVWGSNQSKAQQARLYQLLALYGDDVTIAVTADSAALGYIHYIHGVNPLGLVYLTNMKSAGAEHSAGTMFHNWFAHGTRWSEVSGAMPGPPPGYLVGGPNPDYSMDKCCTGPIGTPEYRCSGSAAFVLCRNSYAPPLGQPPLKSYRQFNEGWPVNSWEVTEPSTGYQAQYIRVLAKYVR
jgi:endoglucanase